MKLLSIIGLIASIIEFFVIKGLKAMNAKLLSLLAAASLRVVRGAGWKKGESVNDDGNREHWNRGH